MSPAALGSWRLRQARALLLWKRPSDSSHRCFATPAWRALCHRLLRRLATPALARRIGPASTTTVLTDHRSAPSGGQKGDLPLPVPYIIHYTVRYYAMPRARPSGAAGTRSYVRPAANVRAACRPGWSLRPAAPLTVAVWLSNRPTRARGAVAGGGRAWRTPTPTGQTCGGCEHVAALAGPEPAAAPRQMAAAAAGRRREPRPPCPPPRWRLRLRQPPTRTHGALASTRVRRCWSSSTERATPSSRLL